jgi:ABC-type Fe3+-siderophore transport system permease subunit
MNITDLTNSTTLQGVAYYTNNQTDGVLFTGGIIVMFIIILMNLLRTEQTIEQALGISSWVTFMVSIMFWFAKLLPTIIPLMFLMIAGFTTLYIYSSRQ